MPSGLVVVYHVSIVAVDMGSLINWDPWQYAAFYALQDIEPDSAYKLTFFSMFFFDGLDIYSVISNLNKRLPPGQNIDVDKVCIIQSF